ncbi:hypothetical protein AB0K89_08530 [Streptomyces cinnamoneus]
MPGQRHGVKAVARAGGLGTGCSPRVQLRRRTGLDPGEYRRRFGRG